MKKVLFTFSVLIVLLFTGCNGSKKEASKEVPDIDIENATIDFEDSASFEKSLNDGEDVAGKIVRFDVVEYHPESSMGIDCWSGEHLNFISEKEIDVKAGDIVTAYITEKPSKKLGSWKIPYAVLDINDSSSVMKDEEKELSESEFLFLDNHPMLYDHVIEAKEFYGEDNKLVKYPKDPSKLKDQVLVLRSTTGGAIRVKEEEMLITEIGINLHSDITFDEALELIKTFIPINILKDSYRKPTSYAYFNESTNSYQYFILYIPTDEEEDFLRKLGYVYVGARIETKGDKVKHITITQTDPYDNNMTGTGDTWKKIDWEYDFLK